MDRESSPSLLLDQSIPRSVIAHSECVRSQTATSCCVSQVPSGGCEGEDVALRLALDWNTLAPAASLSPRVGLLCAGSEVLPEDGLLRVQFARTRPAAPPDFLRQPGTGLASARREGEDRLVHPDDGGHQGGKHRKDGRLALRCWPRLPGPEMRRGRERAAERLCSLRPVGASAGRRPPWPSHRLCAAGPI